MKCTLIDYFDKYFISADLPPIAGPVFATPKPSSPIQQAPIENLGNFFLFYTSLTLIKFRINHMPHTFIKQTTNILPKVNFRINFMFQ